MLDAEAVAADEVVEDTELEDTATEEEADPLRVELSEDDDEEEG